MALLKIITFPDPFLRLKAKTVTDFGKDFQTLVENMFETMRDAPGVGLAAPQIGESLRLVVVEYKDEENENAKPKRFVLVNPEFTDKSEETVVDIEGCLSVPGFYETVERPAHVKISALDGNGRPFEETAEGLLAVCIQHEMDHLSGKLFVDYLSSLKRERIKKKLEKQHKMQD